MKKYIFKQSFTFFKENDELTEQELNNSFSNEFIQRLIKGGYLVEKKDELPKTLEELKTVSGYWVSEDSEIINGVKDICCNYLNKNVFPTKEETEACIALAQLCQLRDRYNDGWKPDWKLNNFKFSIYIHKSNDIDWINTSHTSRVLAFKSKELAQEFIKNFKELIEIAKPLL